MEDFYCVVTFHVTQHALIFENLMISKGIDVKLMPAPRQVSSSCGTSAKIPCELELDIVKLCKENDVPMDSFHKIKNNQGKSWFSKYINR